MGGTEIYVESLARELVQLGAPSLVAAPGEKSEAYEIAGLPVRRFAVTSYVKDLREMYGEGDERAAQSFAEILDQEQPDIVHLHAFTRGVSLRLVRAAKLRNIKVAFTYHTPTVSCQRGTLLRWGNEVCDGKLSVRTCTACTLHAHGLGRNTAQALSYLPRALGNLVGATGLSGGIWTALRMPGLVQLRHSCFHSLMREVNQVIALCQWTKDLLLRNGVPAEKIAVSRHGLSNNESLPALNKNLPAHPLRIVFLGRFDHTKGVDLLIQAVRSLPGLELELDLYGILQTGADHYAEQLRQLAAGDARIRFLPAVPSQHVVTLLSEYHLLAVPSRVLETGPLVVLEAFAAGTPVLGSRLGGIEELVTHGINGLLAEADSVNSWATLLQQCYEQPDLLAALRQGIRPPRLTKAVAQEMLLLYQRLVPLQIPCRLSADENKQADQVHLCT